MKKFTLLFVCMLTAQTIAQNTQKTIPVTIWIHGTSTSSPFSSGDSSMYAVKTCTSSNSYKRFSLLENIDSNNFKLEHSYLFRWSGKLSPSARKKASKDLVSEVAHITNYYKNILHATPRITIISHSHGGNVLLRALHYANKHNVNFYVDRAVLLACPVLAKTKDYIQLPNIKHIISLFSPTDLIQTLDKQKFHPFLKLKLSAFFKRTLSFNNAYNKTKNVPFSAKRIFNNAPQKVVQCRVVWKQGAPWHRVKHLNIMSKTKNWKRFYLRPLDKLMGNKKRGLSHFEFILEPFLIELPALLHKCEKVLQQQKSSSTQLPILKIAL